MTREEALAEARRAAGRAAVLADHAEMAAHHTDPNRSARSSQFAEAGTAWADTARAYAALAQALPETKPEDDNADTDDEFGDDFTKES